MSTNEITAGSTLHLLRGTKYAGAWNLTAVGTPDANGWVSITDDRNRSWFTRQDDAFATESDARSEAKNRRKPRQARTPRPLYGDGAVMAMVMGISTDGSGRRVAR